MRISPLRTFSYSASFCFDLPLASVTQAISDSGTPASMRRRRTSSWMFQRPEAGVEESTNTSCAPRSASVRLRMSRMLRTHSSTLPPESGSMSGSSSR